MLILNIIQLNSIIFNYSPAPAPAVPPLLPRDPYIFIFGILKPVDELCIHLHKANNINTNTTHIIGIKYGNTCFSKLNSSNPLGPIS